MENSDYNALNDRLTRIESSLDKITSSLDQVPALMSIAADTLDNGYQASKEKGFDVEDRLKGGLQLLNRLSEPEMMASLNSLLDTVEKLPGMVSIAADTIDDTITRESERGVFVVDKINNVAHLLNRMTDPAFLENAERALDFVNQLPGWTAMAVDSLDDFIVNNKLVHLDMVAMAKNAGTALSDAAAEPPARVGGVFGLMKTIKDPDRQKALGFLMNFLKHFGKTIK